jgi:hypothetical protein
MAERTTIECDGPGCEEELVDVSEDERESKGWLSVLRPDELGGMEKCFDFCGLPCLSEWSRLEAMLP